MDRRDRDGKETTHAIVKALRGSSSSFLRSRQSAALQDETSYLGGLSRVKCPGCGTVQSTVFKTLDDERTISRQRRCKCGGRWYTEEKVRKGSFVVISEPLVAITGPLVATASGSEQESGSDLVLISSPESDPDQASSKPSDARAMEELTHYQFPVIGPAKAWFVPKARDVEWRTAFAGIDVTGEYRKVYAWLQANPTKKKTPRGMPKFLFGWLERAQNRGSTTPPRGIVSFAVAAEESRQQAAGESRVAALRERLQPPPKPTFDRKAFQAQVDAEQKAGAR